MGNLVRGALVVNRPLHQDPEAAPGGGGCPCCPFVEPEGGPLGFSLGFAWVPISGHPSPSVMVPEPLLPVSPDPFSSTHFSLPPIAFVSFMASDI